MILGTDRNVCATWKFLGYPLNTTAGSKASTRRTEISPVVLVLSYVGLAGIIAAVLDFRNLRDALLAMLPPIGGGLLMFGLMGLFGVDLGNVFTALSMFHTADNASKVGIVSLYHHLDHWGFETVDHQGLTPWVEALGGTRIPRQAYAELLQRPSRPGAAPGRWSAEFTPAQTAEWTPSGQTIAAERDAA